MAARLLADPEADGWERSDFPIVCETCLGPNPYVRMQRMEYGGECHISGRPYTVFRWKPGADARYKKTIICQEVAKAKNVCQVCLLDLDYNLPVQVRDSALGKEVEDLPQSDANKEFALTRLAQDGELDAAYGQQRANDTILRLQRTTPYYKRNRAQICSFFVKGECKRGAECPYRHEMPTTGPLSKQNIKDRYYGVNDPVAEKMLGRIDDMPKLTPPADATIMTLYVGGLTPDITEQDIRDQFYSHGEIMSVRKVERKHCAFVTFATRTAAEAAAEALSNRLIIKGNRCRLLWGKPMAAREPAAGDGPALLPPQVQAQMGGATPLPGGPNFFNLAPSAAGAGPPLPGGAAPYYPSMDPSMMGTRAREARHADWEQSGPEVKRARTDGAGSADGVAAQQQQRQAPPPQQHHGAPPGQLPPQGHFMQPVMVMPPPGMPLHFPPGAAPPRFVMQPPGMAPPRGPLPPLGAAARPPQQRPPQAPAAQHPPSNAAAHGTAAGPLAAAAGLPSATQQPEPAAQAAA